MTRNNGPNTGRNADGTFSKGNSGRPKGSRHKSTLAMEALLEGQAEALTQKAVDMALDGDTTAMRLCLERLYPARKDAPVVFELPPLKSFQDATQAATALLQAVSRGDLTPGEAAAVMTPIEQFRRLLDTADLEIRIEALEKNAVK